MWVSQYWEGVACRLAPASQEILELQRFCPGMGLQHYSQLCGSESACCI